MKKATTPDKVRKTATRKFSNIKSLLLRVKKKDFNLLVSGPRTRLLDYEDLGRKYLGFGQGKCMCVDGLRAVTTATDKLKVIASATLKEKVGEKERRKNDKLFSMALHKSNAFTVSKREL